MGVGQIIYYKKQTNANNNMKGRISYRLGSYFCMEWCMQQFTDKYVKQWNGVCKS